jgi:hypothetical protein
LSPPSEDHPLRFVHHLSAAPDLAENYPSMALVIVEAISTFIRHTNLDCVKLPMLEEIEGRRQCEIEGSMAAPDATLDRSVPRESATRLITTLEALDEDLAVGGHERL